MLNNQVLQQSVQQLLFVGLYSKSTVYQKSKYGGQKVKRKRRVVSFHSIPYLRNDCGTS